MVEGAELSSSISFWNVKRKPCAQCFHIFSIPLFPDCCLLQEWILVMIGQWDDVYSWSLFLDLRFKRGTAIVAGSLAHSWGEGRFFPQGCRMVLACVVNTACQLKALLHCQDPSPLLRVELFLCTLLCLFPHWPPPPLGFSILSSIQPLPALLWKTKPSLMWKEDGISLMDGGASARNTGAWDPRQGRPGTFHGWFSSPCIWDILPEKTLESECCCCCCYCFSHREIWLPPCSAISDVVILH